MGELESALGIIKLKYIDKIIKKKKFIYNTYFKKLSLNKNLRIPTLPKNIEYNCLLPNIFRNGRSKEEFIMN